MDKKSIGIVGATGYTGSELVRMLWNHPAVEIAAITSESHQGLFSDIHPQFRNLADIPLIKAAEIDSKTLDLLFLALPHGVAMEFVRDHWDGKTKIVDLSADFRIPEADLYKQWYNLDHVQPELLKKAAFGLPELFRDKIRSADLVANPGCYPTSAILPLYPLVKEGIIAPEHIIVDAKSGVTGAGVKAKPATHFSTVFGNFSAYGLHKHRHTPEIQSYLQQFTEKELNLLFTPHLLPIDRGILTTTYTRPYQKISNQELSKIYQQYFGQEYFIRLVDQPPAVKNVRGSNFCDIFASYDERTGHIITLSVIDNLVKGAAGQAIQNMNLMFGWPEQQGLQQIPLNP
ncbi:MAG: N-acetyl-gamma-glutamyl-phosphate reductase [Candidatus Cyclobacteriaceae bacterium M3_2C_046]